MSAINDRGLVQAALAGGKNAYIPYSNYRVGAALLTASGEVFTGCNVENAGYSPTICAERTAFVKAISEGHQQFTAIAVVSRGAGSPCGVCRQFMFEFAPDMRIILADLDGNIHLVTTLAELLPHGFGPANLNDD
jgi:cytidine deaminase